MTLENYAKAGELLKKIDAIQKLIIWVNKGFFDESNNINKSNEIQESLRMLLPEIEEHFNQMKKDYEDEFTNLK